MYLTMARKQGKEERYRVPTSFTLSKKQEQRLRWCKNPKNTKHQGESDLTIHTSSEIVFHLPTA